MKATIKERLEEKIKEYCDMTGGKQAFGILKAYEEAKENGELDAWLNGL